MGYRTAHILLIEDDDIDVMAVTRALAKRKVANPLTRARDGVEGLEMLRGTADREPLPTPTLVLLDLNMPRMNGFEFLEQIRSDPDLQRTVVFAMTTSEDDQDRLRAYDSHVAGYVVKSDLGAGFHRLVDMLEGYWKVVELP